MSRKKHLFYRFKEKTGNVLTRPEGEDVWKLAHYILQNFSLPQELRDYCLKIINTFPNGSKNGVKGWNFVTNPMRDVIVLLYKIVSHYLRLVYLVNNI